jgi:hypothetical protein
MTRPSTARSAALTGLALTDQGREVPEVLMMKAATRG